MQSNTSNRRSRICCLALIAMGTWIVSGLLATTFVFAQSPLPDQSDFYQNKLRPQPPHRVLEPPAVKKPAAAPESGSLPI